MAASEAASDRYFDLEALTYDMSLSYGAEMLDNQ